MHHVTIPENRHIRPAWEVNSCRLASTTADIMEQCSGGERVDVWSQTSSGYPSAGAIVMLSAVQYIQRQCVNVHHFHTSPLTHGQDKLRQPLWTQGAALSTLIQSSALLPVAKPMSIARRVSTS